MSGLEVLGGISAVIAIIDGSIKVWESAQRDSKLSRTFETVANRLPVLRDTLQTCHEHFQRVPCLPADVADSLTKTIRSCESKADKLQTIFQETIPGDDNRWHERYRMVARRLGQGSKVEELMAAMTEGTQHLVNYYAVKSARPELCTQLEAIAEEMQSLEPSLPVKEATPQTFNAYGGPQNVSSGSGIQYNSFNTGNGTAHNYGGITGNPTFNFGKS